MPIPGMNRAVVQAVNVARSIADDVRAVFITDEPEDAEVLRKQWERQMPGVPLVVVESPYPGACGAPRGVPRRPRAAWPPDKEARSRSWCCPNTSPADGGSGSSTTSPSSASGARCWGGPHTVVVNVPYRREDVTRSGADESRRRSAGDDARTRTMTAAVVSFRPCPRPRSPVHPRGDRLERRFERRQDRAARDRPRQRKAGNVELIAVHVVEVDWTLPLDADVAGRSEEAQRVLDTAEGVAEAAKATLGAGAPPGAGRRRGARRRGERTGGRPAGSRPSISQALRGRLRHRANHSIRPEERPVCSLGRARADTRGDM